MSDPGESQGPPQELRDLLVSSPEFANMVLPWNYADAANWSERLAQIESQPDVAASFIEAELPRNGFWDEASATYREDAE